MTTTETRTPLFKVGDPAIIVDRQRSRESVDTGTVIKVGRLWATVSILFGPYRQYSNEYQIDKFTGEGRPKSALYMAQHQGYTAETCQVEQDRAELQGLTRFYGWINALPAVNVRQIIDIIKGAQDES